MGAIGEYNTLDDDRAFSSKRSKGKYVGPSNGTDFDPPTSQAQPRTVIDRQSASQTGNGTQTNTHAVPSGADQVQLNYDALDCTDRFTVSDPGGNTITGTGTSVSGTGSTPVGAIPGGSNPVNVTVDQSEQPQITRCSYNILFIGPNTSAPGIKLFTVPKGE